MYNLPLGVSVSVKKEKWLSTFRENGISQIELLADTGLESWAKSTVERISSLGLNLWSVHLPFGAGWDLSNLDKGQREQTVENFKKWIELAGSWGAKVCVIHPSLEPIADEEREKKLAISRESLKELGATAKEQGVKLAVECLPRTCLGNTRQEIEYLTDSPALYVCCDVNHLFKETPQDFIRALGEKVVTTHMSDWDGIDERHWLPGEGINDWQKILAALDEVGYEGPFLFEVKNSEGAALQKSWRKIQGQG